MKKFLIITALALLPILSQGQSQSLTEPIGNSKSFYWGWNVGGVVTELPISMAIDSGFAVMMADVYYAKYLTPTNSSFRAAMALGLYGFQVLLPVPRAGIDMTIGRPNDDIQFKAYVGGLYDLVVGGHAGLDIGLGLLFANRFNVAFHIVPIGTDSKRNYQYMKGSSDVDGGCTKDDPCVEMPYFGIFAGMQF